MHYRHRQMFGEGRAAASNGLLPTQNPYKPKTNFHRYWNEGYVSVPPSKTPVDHTYKIGDIIKGRITSVAADVNNAKVVKIMDVPEDQIVFNPNIHPDENDTGVGHHQWLILEGRNSLLSAALVELVNEE